ncbi:DUF1453 family protein [Streptomyces sp. ActVer]|uniref:CcdC protein domain-containing protein n=1 Tax=Streptomyces sp. ActVer TaxID=3014558 RepID=UPI0022B52443|nr:CcdC protein domain-containing protein [Streptomyces sp. ActVer]MCZ4508784.1 DUF1453 family protein [Streptomyces sp. ActVer]
MSGLVDALVILAVVVLVIARQFRTRRMATDRSWWVVPAVLVFLALREPGLLDPDHRTLSALLLGTELLIGLATGVGWAWTTRMWRTPDGTVWSRSSKASGLVWTAGIALRAGLFGLGAALGLRQDSSALLLALAVTLLVRSGIMVRRAQTLPPARRESTAYGDGMPQPSRKERV